MGYYDNRQIPLFLAANGKRPVHLTYPFAFYHYDTPGTLTKTSWFVTVCQTIRLSTFKSNSQATTNCSAYDKQVKNYTHRKSNTHKLNNQNAEKIVIKHIITNLATNIHIFNQSTLIMLK